MKPEIKPIHPYAWLWEPLAAEPSFLLRSMFGAKAVYLHGRIMLCFMHRQPPWQGVLVGTERAHHPSLLQDFSWLKPHPILGKWLYLADAGDAFDSHAEELVRRVARGDPRIGVLPQARRRRSKRSKDL